MLALFNSFLLKGIPVRNRVILPPMVCFGYAGSDGKVTDRNVNHYRERAEGGSGIIVTEATCVMENGRITASQLGIWSDSHIPGLSRIAEAVKGAGAVSLIQLHHSGILASADINPSPAGASADPKIQGSREMTHQEIKEVREAFVNGAIRAREAGFDGVQLHGAHGYLLCQFASTFYNKREDEFNGDVPSRMRLAEEIIRDIRKACGESFILAYRMGANSPSIEDGIAIAGFLEQQSVDLLDVSHGGSLITLPRPPAEFPFNWICYGGTVIHEHVAVPVSVVNEIHSPERANYLIENKLADFVNIGRPQLADPHWVSKAQYHDEMIVNCLSCKPRCKWYTDSSQCPAYRIRIGSEH